MSFAIGIPTLNRMDLLLPSLIEYSTSDFPDIDIHIVDNGNQNIKFIEELNPRVHVYEQENNLGVAGSWNFLCKEIYKTKKHALLINDDVYLGYGTQHVLNIIEKYPHSLVQSFISWSVILIPQTLYNFVGEFDETFYPAYYEDSDYLYRMKLKGLRQVADKELNPKTVRISMTREKDPEFVDESMRVNRERYIAKWGNSPLLETFTTPYNQ